MIICIALVLITILGIVAWWWASKYDTDWIGTIIGSMGVIFTFISVIMLIISMGKKIDNHFTINADINKFLDAKTTIEYARVDKTNVETAAIQLKIIECNQWLAKMQYYNKTMLGWWIPDKVDRLKSIR